MKKERISLFLTAMVFGFLPLSGCTTTERVESKIMVRAVFDLDCAEEDVTVTLVDGSAMDGTYGAVGCGKRIRYQAQCSLTNNCLVNVDSPATEK